MRNSPLEHITGVLLAGGTARRMGGCDKSLLPLDQRSLLDHVVERARPQVGQLILNTNSDAAQFSRFGLPLVTDTVPGFAGPLAGVLAAMEWLRTNSMGRPTRWVASFPTDSPFFPADLVGRLYQAVLSDGKDGDGGKDDGKKDDGGEDDASGADGGRDDSGGGDHVEIVCAASNGRRSPLFALWSTTLMEALSQQLQSGDRKVGNFLEQRRCAVVHFDADPVDPFFNINTAEDLETARKIISGRAIPD